MRNRKNTGSLEMQIMVLDKIQNVLAEAGSVVDIQPLIVQAGTIAHFARAARLGLDFQNYATEIKLRAERKAGELLAKMQLHGGDRKSRLYQEKTLEDMGFTKNQSSRWQKLYRIPEGIFNTYIHRVISDRDELTTEGLLRYYRKTLQNKQGVKIGKDYSQGHTNKPNQNLVDSQLQIINLRENIEEMINYTQTLYKILEPLSQDSNATLKSGQRRYFQHWYSSTLELLTQIYDQLSDK